MKILILSNTPWSKDNSFGNSFSNLFEGMDGVEIANIFCRCGKPDNSIVKRYFQMTEKSLIKNLILRDYPSGREVSGEAQSEVFGKREERLVNHARRRRLFIYFWVRNLIWKIGRWKSPELERFILEFKPDLLFQPVYYSTYLNDIALYIKQTAKVPMVCYVSDDVYTLRQFSLSPFYWINRMIIRNRVRKVIESCEYLYVISGIQKKEYEKCFSKECRILTKGADFTGEPPLKRECTKPLSLVYTGNIGQGRWKTLALIGRALRSVNREGERARLSIYSMTPVSKRIKAKLNIEGASSFMGGVPSSQVAQVQKDADILVHVESFDLKERLHVHQSFSTKLADYFAAGRCIFAVGSMDTASIMYLYENDAAVIATSKKEIGKRLTELTGDTGLLEKYARNAWECGKRHHQIGTIQNRLYHELNAVIKEGKK